MVTVEKRCFNFHSFLWLNTYSQAFCFSVFLIVENSTYPSFCRYLAQTRCTFLFSGRFNVLINCRKKLKSKPSSHLAPGILCEQGNSLFMLVKWDNVKISEDIGFTDQKYFINIKWIYVIFALFFWYPRFAFNSDTLYTLFLPGPLFIHFLKQK